MPRAELDACLFKRFLVNDLIILYYVLK